jgi:predicted RNase H-like HicB family nuclease
MTEYSAVYEQTAEGWAYFPDLPGCTTFGRTRDEVERNGREAIAAHVALLRDTGRPVSEPTRTAV